MNVQRSRSRAARLVVALPLGVAVIVAAPARADAPAGRYSIAAPGTVLDKRTGLTWQQGVDAKLYAWADAQAFCAALTLQGGGWRVPSMKELQTLLDVRLQSPAIDPTFFPDTPVESFWSSSLWVGDPTFAWHVYFSLGYARYKFTLDTPLRVRCVR
jgi:hypothetical protein